MFFQKQIISSRNVIMFVSLNASLGILNIEVEIFQFFQDEFIDRNSMKTNYDPTV